jgi:hypothetical protein
MNAGLTEVVRMTRIYWCLVVAGSLLVGGAFMHEGLPKQPLHEDMQYSCVDGVQDRRPT